MKTIFSAELEAVYEEARAIFAADLGGFSSDLFSLFNLRGKSIRPLLLLLFARHSGGGRPPEAALCAAALESLHLATLIQDDLLDQADTRRGEPAFHVRVGRKRAVLSADFLVVRALRALAGRMSPDILQCFLNGAGALVEGEIAQTLMAEAGNATENAYLSAIEKKTGSLFVVAAVAGTRLARADEPALRKADAFGRAFGTAYQILDDLNDLTESAVSAGKAPFADLRNGIQTLPVIHFLRSGGDGAALKSYWKAGLRNDVLALLESTGSPDYAAGVARDHFEKALAEADHLLSEADASRLRTLTERLSEKTQQGVRYGI